LIRYHPKNNQYLFFNIKKGLINDNVLSIASKEGVLWIATLGGVSKISYNNELNAQYKIENFEKADGIGSNFIYQVFIDSKDRIWFATDGKGITVFEKNKFNNYSTEAGLASKTIYSIAEDANGVLWLNTAKDGLVYYDGKTFKTFTSENGLRSYTNASIVADNYENLIVISNKGVDMINVNSKNIHYHDSELDFVNLEPNINANHKPANTNEIWFASQNNIYVYYQCNQELWRGPKTILRSVKINSEMIDHTIANDFNYQQNYISFDVIGLWYHKPSEVKYKYKLEGYDVNWIQTTDNSINYSKLPPGTYTFKISSSANSTFNDSKIIEYKFNIQKPFWLSTWFIILVVIALIFIVFIFLKYRIKQLKRKEQYERDRVKFELDTLRNQINPHFLFNSFNTLMGLIEIDSDRAVKYVEHLSDFYRELLNQRDSDVISLDREIELLKNYIYILDQRFGNKLVVSIDIPSMFLNKSIAALSLQLLVENAIKHNEISREYPLEIYIH
ncbi:MAG: histidine kinase, partial [bacterium]